MNKSNFIEATTVNNEKVLLNISHIISVSPESPGSEIYLTPFANSHLANVLRTTEPYDKIKDLISSSGTTP